jgi:GNAT superfamily N-acetyltransferase
MDVHVRRANPGEHRLLSEIAYQSKAHWGYSSADLAAWHAELTVSRESIRVQPTFVAELDDEVVGFFQLRVADRAQLEHFWVMPRSVRAGVGRAMLSRAVHEVGAAGHDTLRIDADPHAEAFYLACGARKVGERAAPIAAQPHRVRPQLELTIPQP